MEHEDYSEIGALLRNVRELQGLSVIEVSHLLHIRYRYIIALEEGKLKDLPGLIYAKGYLQAYAAFLDLDKDEILRRFEQIEAVLARKGFYFPKVGNRVKSPPAIFVWGSLVAALFIYVVWSAFEPAKPRVSVVEHFPAKVAAIPPGMQDVPCLKPQNDYYPPCTMARERAMLLPLRRQRSSIMELAYHSRMDK